MKTLVFGGTFNPPHLGHQMMIEQVLSKTLADGSSLDQLWILPVGQHSFAKKFVSNKHRLAMLELMVDSIIEKNPTLKNKIFLEKYELEHDEESQTFSTLKALSKKHPEEHFSFLIGSDNLEKFHLWNDYQLMLKEYPFYVYPRIAFEFLPFYEGMIALKDFPKMEVSSTKVRMAFKNKTSLDGLLDAKVIKYIKENKLFV
jgi:nicotinate-nucleotide adenylyltransferase